MLSCIYSTFIDAGRKRRVPLEYINDYNKVRTSIVFDNATNISKRAVNELYKKMKSINEDESKSAETLWSVCHSNIYTVSKDKGQTFYKTKKEIEPIIKQLKRKLSE